MGWGTTKAYAPVIRCLKIALVLLRFFQIEALNKKTGCPGSEHPEKINFYTYLSVSSSESDPLLPERSSETRLSSSCSYSSAGEI